MAKKRKRQSQTAAETKERMVEKRRQRDRARWLLKLLVKDKLLHSRKVPVNVKEWQLRPLRREKQDYSGWAPTSLKDWVVNPRERETRLQQMRDWQLAKNCHLQRCRSLWCPPCKNFCPQYCPETDRARDHPTVYKQATTSSATPTVPWPSSSGTPINDRGLHDLLCLSNIVPYLSCWLWSSLTKCSHYWQLLQTSHVWWWSVCQTPSVPLFCTQHWDAVACSSGRLNLCLSTPSWCSTVFGRAAWYGWTWGKAFSNRVLHYAASLWGTRQYWFKQQSRLIAMIDTLVCPLYSLPTVQLTYNGQSWHASSALITLNAVPAATKLYWRIQPLQIGHRIQKFIEAVNFGPFVHMVCINLLHICAIHAISSIYFSGLH